METLEARDGRFVEETYQRIRDLCHPPMNDPITGAKGMISDVDIEEIAQCLRDLSEDEASARPRTYAVLFMIRRLDLLKLFAAKGLLDNSFPYPNRRSLPPQMYKYEPDACHHFLEMQAHVMSPALELERLGESPHVLTESGDTFLENLGRLGKGGDAKVDKVKSKITGKLYARKRMYRHKDFNKNKAMQDRFVNEVQILKKLDYHHLVRIVGSYSDAKSVAILMIPIADMDLKQYLRSCHIPLHRAGRTLFRTYYGCLASAIAYLHENNIRHKDIKPNNVLLNGNNIYITDFGTAIEIQGDSSVTKGTVRVKTAQYQSPEVARGAPRGKASDIWSLGVTFLEMTTILRSETLDSMQKFLLNHGSKQEYVYENIQGAMQWSGYLAKSTKLPREDNAPMQWIKDLLEEKSSNRPSADQLCQNIRQVHEGIFCCKRCQDDGSTVSETSSEEERDDDDTIRATMPPENSITSSRLSERVQAKKTNHPETIHAKPDSVKSTLDPRGLPLHRRVNVMHRVFSYLPNLSVPAFASYGVDLPSVVEDPILPSRATPNLETPVQTVDPYACNLPGSFPENDENWNESVFQYQEMIDDTPDIAKSTLRGDQEQVEVVVEIASGRNLQTDSATSEYSRTLDGPIAFSYSLEPENPPLINTNNLACEDTRSINNPFAPTEPHDVTVRQEHKDKPIIGDFVVSDDESNVLGTVPAVLTSTQDEAGAIPSPLSLLQDEDCLFTPGPSGFIVKIHGSTQKPFSALQTLLRQPSMTSLHRSRSDEHIEIQRQTKSLLEENNMNDGERLQHSPKRRPSEPEHLADIAQCRAAISTELHAFKQELHNLQIPSDHSASLNSHENTGEPTLHQVETDCVLTTSLVDEPAEMPETPEAAQLPSPNYVIIPGYPLPVDRHRPTASTAPRKGSLLSWFSNARGPPKTPNHNRLTGENLERLNSTILNNDVQNGQRPSLRSSPPRFKVESASVYMRKVFDDAASSVATSVMSTTTREKFKLAGLMLPAQDVTLNYLGTYTKLGKTHAVRTLLKAGCCPGTKNRPRPDPIFNVVRGRSSKHTKCLRALIEHGVNVNVKKRGKTPLIEAVEQEPWSGYVTVIYLLLMAGADPNAKDGAGDSPLLKLLNGGFTPLKEHHRKALALLLSSSWNTNAKVTPLGTQNKPLHLAVRRNDSYAVGMLLEKDDSVIEAKNSEFLTPLLLASRSWTTKMPSDQLEILDLLLEKKADPNVGMLRTGKTALHIAVSNGLLHAVERLLEHGADPNRLTNDKRTVFDLAEESRANHRCHRPCTDCDEVETLLKTKFHNGPK